MIHKMIILGLAAGLAGCSVGPNSQSPAFGSSVLSNWFGLDAVNNETALTDTAPVELAWWSVFQDPLLEKYIQTSAAQNKDVTASLANLRRARALRSVESGALLPMIGASSTIERGDSGSATGGGGGGGGAESLYDAGFDASWELDIFGGNRRSVEAADARVGVAAADYEGVMLATLSEVARTYYEVRGLQKRIAVLEQSVDLLQKTSELIDARFEAGEASEFDRVRALGEYQLTLARIPNLKADCSAAVFRLSVLMGLPPESLMAEMSAIQPLPTPPDLVPVGLRADILRRRPDIRSAERELAASVADIGVETAELFPKFFITGDAGSRASVFGDLFTASAGAWSLAGLMQWRLFEGGAIRAQIEAEKAESIQAFAMYEQSVLEALADAETALIRYGREVETRKRLEEALDSRQRSVFLANELLNAGEADFLAVLDAERDFVSAQDTLILSETDTIIKLIALYTALGGGWEVYAESRAEQGLPDTPIENSLISEEPAL